MFSLYEGAIEYWRDTFSMALERGIEKERGIARWLNR